MNELDLARQIKDGLLPSPWKVGGMTLFAMRITGTGLSYRSGHDEFVWRDSSIYLNDEFLARCNGLPVIWWHPEDKPELDSEEFAKRIVGTVMLPYIKGEDVWGICRIYDESAIKLMTDGQLSTSPAVVFKPNDGNRKVELNGETFLIEGNPSHLDHLAICDNGVWDKGGEPTGVLNDSLTDKQEPAHMAEETEAEKKAREEREDAARKDAERWDRLDKFMDSATSRLDAMEADKARKDAEEDRRADAARMDAARKDKFAPRKDGEAYKDWKARHDADEAAMMDALVKGGCETDKARKDAKDCRMDAEEGERKDGGESFEKWAKEEKEEPEHKGDKAKRDAAEKEEKERMEREDAARRDARHDSQATELAELRAAIKRLTTEVPAGERDALAAAQSRADSVAAMFGDRAPTPMAGEASLDYRKRLLKAYQQHSPKFKDTRFDSADSAMLEPVEGIVYADAVNAAKIPALARPGILMPIQKRDAAGRTITTYVGDPLAWMSPYMTHGQNGRINRNPNGPN